MFDEEFEWDDAKARANLDNTGSTNWLGPVVVSGTDRASSPTIRIIADQVVVAYRTPIGVGLTNLPVLIPAQILGIHDGPDGVDPIGMIAGVSFSAMLSSTR